MVAPAWMAKHMAMDAERIVRAIPGCQLPFDDPRRTEWGFHTRPHTGVSFGDMNGSQYDLVHSLLRLALHNESYAQVCAVIALEDVITKLDERWSRSARDHWITIFGPPGSDAWGWRFEGFEISVNVTVVGAEVSATPLFLGAGPSAFILRPLTWQEDLGQRVIGAAPEALIADWYPDDLLSGTKSQLAEDDLQPFGVRGGDLSPEARKHLELLVNFYRNQTYAGVHIEDASDYWFAFVRPAHEVLYYRIVGPGFLAEFHRQPRGLPKETHTVWRDPGNDFGAALLAGR